MSSSYHSQTDGTTERADRTIMQMLCQCDSLDNKNWAIKLLTIEVAKNLASSSTTGNSPFLLNNSRSIIWNYNTEFPGVKKFAQNMKDAILTQNSITIT